MPQPAVSFFGSIPSGIEGTRATLKIMVMVVRKCLKPTTPQGTQNLLLLRTTASRLVQGCGEKDYVCEASKLQEFVRDQIRYLRDMRSAETLQTPEATLREKSGDCDDKSILLASLAETVGFSARFHAVGVRGEGYSHVFTELLIPNRGWVAAETIPIDNLPGGKAPLGWFPPDITSHMVAHI